MPSAMDCIDGRGLEVFNTRLSLFDSVVSLVFRRTSCEIEVNEHQGSRQQLNSWEEDSRSAKVEARTAVLLSVKRAPEPPPRITLKMKCPPKLSRSRISKIHLKAQREGGRNPAGTTLSTMRFSRTSAR